MQHYSETQIGILHAEFRSHKKYGDKLAFFDNLFGIIPFSFPEFDPRLGYFFQPDQSDALISIFKNERNNPDLYEKKFQYRDTFIFNIKPANSNSAVYSNYVLSSFLARKPVFEDWIRNKITGDKKIEFFLQEANAQINHIEYCLQNQYDKSLGLQCMSVFYKGCLDAFTNQVNLPDKKRKFTELYLYAQGIIYAAYIHFVKKEYSKSRKKSLLAESVYLNFPGKLELLYELGIIEFLKNKYAGLDTISFENKVAEIICLITGEFMDQREFVLSYVTDGAGAPGNPTRAQKDLHRKIMQITTRK